MRLLLLSVTVLLLSACASKPLPVIAPEPEPVAVILEEPSEPTFSQQGRASWYGNRHHGKKTASGEPFNQHALTAAHRTLPFGTRIKVTNVSNQRSVVVRVNDRGPFSKNRVLDVSRKAAEELGMINSGTATISLHTLDE